MSRLAFSPVKLPSPGARCPGLVSIRAMLLFVRAIDFSTEAASQGAAGSVAVCEVISLSLFVLCNKLQIHGWGRDRLYSLRMLILEIGCIMV